MLSRNGTGAASPEQTEPGVYALAQIRSAEFPPADPLYTNYPAMKLGGLEQVAYYAEHLLPEVLRVIAMDDTPCVLSAPPVFRLPSAANLLARQIHALLSSMGKDIAFEEIRMLGEYNHLTSEQKLHATFYSQRNRAQREAERASECAFIDMDTLAPGIVGRRVIMINDIHVTGAQQRALTALLMNSGARACDWIYIFVVDPELAQAHPGIEYELNTSRLADTDDYIALLNSDSTQIRFTAKCVMRLFKTDEAEFTRIIQALRPERRTLLHNLALREEHYNVECFRKKWHILRQSMGGAHNSLLEGGLHVPD